MKKRPSSLQKPLLSHGMQCALGGALLGAAAFLLLYGLTPLNVTDDTWIRGGYVEKDIIQHYAGWLFYRTSPLTFPLGLAQNIGYPTGSYVGFTDSIPLFAILFKLFSPLLPATFQYFGWWAFLCQVMQGAAAALLLSLFSQKRLQVWLLGLLFVAAPILLDRQLRHSALGAQWLVLLSLYLYFKHRRSRRFFSPGFVALCALSILIHPYFTPMVLAVLFAMLLENAVFARNWFKPLLSLLVCLAAIVLVGWVAGVFSGGSGGGSTPYGYFSMNLNALFNPQSVDTNYSLFIPPLSQRAGNYDGFNYLGLGVLLALAALLADCLVHFKAWRLGVRLRQRFGLIIVCACLSLFAVSTTVTLFGRELFALTLPPRLLALASTLRSSGRMFYPVWYLLLLCVCVYLLRRPPLRWRTLAAAGLVAVQLLDLSPALVAKAQSFRPYHPITHTVLQSSFWQQAAGRYAHLVSLDAEGSDHGVDLALYAADNGMTTDDPFAARYDPARRQAQVAGHMQALAAGDYSADTLYITANEGQFLQVAEALDGPVYCARIDGLYYVLAPLAGGAAYNDPTAVEISDYPFTITDYSDALWEHGVLATDRRVVTFTDTPFARRHLENAVALAANGTAYAILDISFKDAGWIMVTLDIADAALLAGRPLEPVL